MAAPRAVATHRLPPGASTADVVLLLIDARHGVVEQTRRHLAVVGLLRVRHVVVAVNKVDLVADPADAYDRILLDVEDLRRSLAIDTVTVVPVCALHGDNVVEPGPRTAWFAGPTLLEVLETLPLEEPERPAAQYLGPVGSALGVLFDGGLVEAAGLLYRIAPGRSSGRWGHVRESWAASDRAPGAANPRVGIARLT